MSSDVMTFREHLVELRKRAKVVFFIFVILFLIFLAAPADPSSFLSFTGTYVPLISFFLAKIKADLLPAGWVLIANRLNEPLEVYLVASLVLAIAFTAPVAAYETFKFVDSALTPNERKLVYPFVISNSTLFAVGAFFGYFFLARFLFIALGPFFIAAQAQPLVDVVDFYFTVLLVITMTGVAFTAPVYMFLLVRFGILQRSSFTKNRVIIYVAIYILTAVITPDGGPLLDIILAGPIIVLVELSVFLADRMRRKESFVDAMSKFQEANQTLKCKYCTAEVGPSEIFCPNCGRANS